jgi:hypothetical protein
VTPFLTARAAFRKEAVHLLPTGSVVMVFREDAAPLFLTPHNDVRIVNSTLECAKLSPNFIKCLIGEPRRHLGVALAATAHPMLEPFTACRSIDETIELLVDLRESLAVTPDERDFLELWTNHCAVPESLPTSDRWVQRLCLRYAGQSPKRLTTLARLARTLSADNRSGLHNSLGTFADASHYVRVCHALTGHSPKHWRHLSHTFY